MPLVHRHAHDYLRLIRRWRKIARSSGLNLRAFCESSGYEIFVLEAARPVRGGASIYFSAGIHGDEAAASEALVTWAEENPSLLKKIQPMIFPCLNPWGLNNNCRFDSDGRDLNRCFHNNDVPQIAAQMRVLHDARFDLAILLHEDFDAQGYYI